MVALERVGARGSVVAVDPRPIEPAPGLTVVRGRVGDPTVASRLGSEPFDVVLSDMSPSISGAYSTDHARSVELVRSAHALAIEVLAPDGTFVAKVFAGDMIDELVDEIRANFAEVLRTKPPASRAPSSEIYLVARGFRRGRSTPARGDSSTGARPAPDI